ncbi:MAG TPA: hypothetical protein VNZ54_08515 [bacterium]|nr:hypothetical protein [bacterium]HXB98081.1 hypothetical protein [bacterium]
MQYSRYRLVPWLLVAAFGAGCSGMGTSMSRVGRMGRNKGYEIPADLPVVETSAMAVLKTRGYDVSVKADPDSGAENAGQVVIGQRITNYAAVPGGTAEGVSAPAQMGTRDLVDVYLSKKWEMGDDRAAINVTLVNIVGGSYLRKSAGGVEVETELTKDSIEELRGEIERSVSDSRRAKPAAMNP